MNSLEQLQVNNPLWVFTKIVTGDAEMGLTNKVLSVLLKCRFCKAHRFVKTSNKNGCTKCLTCRRVWNVTDNIVDDTGKVDVSAEILRKTNAGVEEEMEEAITLLEAVNAEKVRKRVEKVEKAKAVVPKPKPGRAKVANAEMVSSDEEVEELPRVKALAQMDDNFFEAVTKAVGTIHRKPVHRGDGGDDGDTDIDEDAPIVAKVAPKAVSKAAPKAAPKAVAEDDKAAITRELIQIIAEQNVLIARQNELIAKLLK
jgi:hypothetical protein